MINSGMYPSCLSGNLYNLYGEYRVYHVYTSNYCSYGISDKLHLNTVEDSEYTAPYGVSR